MGARVVKDDPADTATMCCSCCRQVTHSMVQVAPMWKARFAYLCESCCEDITEAAKEFTNAD